MRHVVKSNLVPQFAVTTSWKIDDLATCVTVHGLQWASQAERFQTFFDSLVLENKWEKCIGIYYSTLKWGMYLLQFGLDFARVEKLHFGLHKFNKNRKGYFKRIMECLQRPESWILSYEEAVEVFPHLWGCGVRRSSLKFSDRGTTTNIEFGP